mmetsp:Transcript_29363/g.39700  ORF Transcript_29363/g.39700 Transcript_29363/m.39700 type:complete len:200 (+) Transcript_29363:650-1249(+)
MCPPADLLSLRTLSSRKLDRELTVLMTRVRQFVVFSNISTSMVTVLLNLKSSERPSRLLAAFSRTTRSMPSSASTIKTTTASLTTRSSPTGLPSRVVETTLTSIPFSVLSVNLLTRFSRKSLISLRLEVLMVSVVLALFSVAWITMVTREWTALNSCGVLRKTVTTLAHLNLNASSNISTKTMTARLATTSSLLASEVT